MIEFSLASIATTCLVVMLVRAYLVAEDYVRMSLGLPLRSMWGRRKS